MSWSKFKFNCRFITKQLPLCGDRSTVLANLENTKTVFLFDKYKLSKTHQYLFDKLLHIQSDEELTRSAKIYSQLDLQASTFDPVLRKKYRNIQIYLTWLFLVFFTIGGIYRNFVLPTFQDIYKTFDISLPNLYFSYDMIWFSGSSLLAATLLISFILNHFIKKLDTYLIKRPQSNLFKLFVPKVIKEQMALINTLFMSPLREEDNAVTSSIKWIENNGLNVAEELNQLIFEQKNVLENYIEKRMSMLIGVVFSMIVFLIYQLITVMYEPIFTMGEIL